MMWWWPVCLGGLGVALAAGPLGCLLLWRRWSFLGDGMGHAALLGVVLGYATGWPSWAAIVCVAAGLMVCLAAMQVPSVWPPEAVLAAGVQCVLALALWGFGRYPNMRFEAYLWGDLLGLKVHDVYGIACLLLFFYLGLWWHARLYCQWVMDPDWLMLQRRSVTWYPMLWGALLGVWVSFAVKVVGAFLMASLLVLPALVARIGAATPRDMLIRASVAAVAMLGGGLWISWVVPHCPLGAAVVCVGCGFWMVSRMWCAWCG